MPLDAPRMTHSNIIHLHYVSRKFLNTMPLNAPKMSKFDNIRLRHRL